VAEALLAGDPISSADLPDLVGHERKRARAAADRLQRRLVLTAAGREERERGWPAVVLDLLARRYRSSLRRRLPQPEEALAELAATVLRSAGEVSAADLAAAIGCPRPDAAAALDRLALDGQARHRDEEGFRLWSA
jgi:hypothetical protein